MTPASPPAADALCRDLALVLPEVRPATSVEIKATIAGQSASLQAALERAGELINASAAPALVGLHQLTIEAVREAIALAEKMRGRLLPWPGTADPAEARHPVVQTASLGHVFACQMIIWVGCDGASGAIAERIAERQLLAAFVDAGLETVERLRREMAANPAAEPIGKFQRVAAVLKPGCDLRVASQWHKLAAQMQPHVRFCVFPLPDPHASANARGAGETVTWQTGLSLAEGGIDFADGAPRRSPGGLDAAIRSSVRSIDLLIDMRVPTGCEAIQRIVIGPTSDPAADVSFVVPGLVTGLAARVMRCDGIVLWLCDDPGRAPADPTVNLLRQIRERTQTPA